MAKKRAQPGGVGHAAIARICLALPGTTKNVQWGNDLVFKVGGKMFAVMGANPGEPLDHLAVLPEGEIRAYLARSHALVAAGLSKKLRAELGISGGAGAIASPPSAKSMASRSVAAGGKKGRRR